MSDLTASAIDAAADLHARVQKNEKLETAGVIDVMVVGAGAAGLGAAFRCVELGMKTLLIDRDDVLSILRDWVHSTKDYVDANYGAAGRKLPFPCGAKLVSALAFKDHTPAIALYNRWITALTDAELPIRTGMELFDLHEQPDGTWEAECRRGKEKGIRFKTRSVILALGSGVPMTLEIPGDTSSIATRVGTGEKFLGGPACVIGSGTSAAEAVISIARLKEKTKDKSPVYWSYRTANLPKVNDTLDKHLGEVVKSERFRNLPSSQGMAVLHDPDGTDYLIVRVDRFQQNGGATRSNFLEFATSRVLACIGSQPPVEFLNRLGIKDLHAVDQDVEALGITPWYESCRKNVFLVGEPLSPAYIQTTDFRPEADQVTVIQHAGSFKQSLRDGVLAAEAIHERLASGATDERLKQLVVELQDGWKRDFVPDDVPRPAAPVEVVPAVTALFARIIEGSREIPFSFPVGAVRVDYETGQVSYGKAAGPGATLLDIRGDGCYVTDASPEPRTMLQIGVERTIAKDEIFFAGSQALCVKDVGGQAMLAVLDSEWKSPVNLIPFPAAGQDVGRRQSRSVAGLDASDSYLSQRHFRIQGEGNAFTIRDYGSLNGTFVSVRSPAMKLVKGDTVWVGQSGFRFDGLDGAGTAAAAQAAVAVAPAPAKAPAPVASPPPSPPAPSLRASVVAPAAPAAAAPPAAAAAAPAAPAPAKESPARKSVAPAVEGPPSVRIRPLDKTLQLDPEKTLLSALKSAELATKDSNESEGHQKLLYSCDGVPSCYLCIVKVLSGAANLNEISKKESKGIKLKTSGLNDEGFSLDPNACRLACLAQAKGPVEVEFLGNTDV